MTEINLDLVLMQSQRDQALDEVRATHEQLYAAKAREALALQQARGLQAERDKLMERVAKLEAGEAVSDGPDSAANDDASG